MANIYCGSVQYTAVAVWAALTAYVSTSNGGRGDYVRQISPASGSERVFRCTTSGTSLSAEPAWVLTKNATTTEAAGPVWTECTGQEADQTAALWKAPHSHVENAFAATWGAAGDRFFVAHDNACTRAAARTLTSPGTSASPCEVICVNATTGSSMPPVSADIRATATINTTGASGISLAGVVSVCDGVRILAGSAANVANVTANATAVWNVKNGLLALNNTNTTSIFSLGSAGGLSLVSLMNTPLQFGAVQQYIAVYGSRFVWKATPSGVAGSVPTNLFSNDNDRACEVIIDDVDLSAAGAGKTLVAAGAGKVSKYLFKDCKYGSGVVVAAAPNTYGFELHSLRSDSSGTNYRDEKYIYLGTHVVDTALIRTGGASNGTTSLAWKATATANAKWALPFECIPLTIWNDTTAANVTVTVEGLQDPRTSVTLPNNDDVWFEISYLGSAASPLGSVNTGTKADSLAVGTALTASTQAWDSLVTARANTTGYALGDRIKVASNAGRVFICTAAGTSAGSEPAGYASAVDGGSVTDNAATFKAAVRFKQSITLSAPQPAMKGHIYVTPKVGKASGIYYIDPKLVLS